MHRAWVLLLVTCMLVLPSVPAVSSTTTGHLPSPRAGTSAATVQDVAYVIGGRLTDGNYSSDIIAYDGHAATLAGTLPRATEATQDGQQSTAAASVAGVVYVFGGAAITQAMLQPGQTTNVPVATRDIIAFDPAAGKARTTLDRLPSGAWGMAAVAVGPVVYLFGGFTFDVTNTAAITRDDWVLRYDPRQPEGLRMTTLAEKLPFAVQDAASGLLGSEAFLLGGLGNNDNATNPCPHAYRTNTTTGGQDDLGPMPVCASAAIIGFDTTNERVLGLVGTLPQRTQFVSAARVGDGLLLPGGRLQDGTASQDVVAFDATNGAHTLPGCLADGVFAAPVATVAGALLQFGGRGEAMASLTDAIVTIDPTGGPANVLPGAPHGLTASHASDGAHLAWSPPACGASSVTSYIVQRAVGDGPFSDLATTTQTSLIDTSSDPSVTNAYRVAAVSAVGQGAFSVPVQLIPPPPATVPSPPLHLVAAPKTNVPDVTTELSWERPASDGGAPLRDYVVLRADGRGAEQEIGHTPTTSFTDEHPPLARSATYRVVAVNVVGASHPSNEARVTPFERASAL